ncbi:hypothetical protein KOR42_51680 [Thalassoglobus neptunius]|uniref:Uncharacterized protein n=1 Tax=Thalassoglobus neptunius TaxID=1938619 RepID=A0A5C5VNX9_9PLAN|nr:hypothetical protein [Thalassoglobus neptunius]TWT39790.1 hypothetical protein KOR42_51680 [Thalassoglobus neptunius]
MAGIRSFIRGLALWIHQHRVLAEALISFVLMMVAGIYASQFATECQSATDLLTPTFWQKWIHVWGLAAVVMLIVTILLRRLSVYEGKQKLISRLHESFARAILFPRVQHLNLRVFCHKTDPAKQELVPLCSWSWHHYPDNDSRVPYGEENIFVIAKAFRSSDAVAEDLPEGHLDAVPEGVVIWEDLTSVIAASIRDYDVPQCEPIGTVSIDFDRTLAQMGLGTPNAVNEAKELARRYGHLLYQLLKGRT